VGSQEGVDFEGGSYIVGESWPGIISKVIKTASFGTDMREEIIQAELDPEHIRKARMDLPLLRDVRPELSLWLAGIEENLYFPSRSQAPK
jgi:predicted amidohydrolase